LAAVIIFTSLAPSPIASVVLPGCHFQIMCTTSAFYLGETRHAITTFIFSASSINLSLSSYLAVILYNDSPETIIACYELECLILLFSASIN